MDAVTLQAVDTGQVASSAALPVAAQNISAEARTVITNVTANTQLSESEKTSLVAATASIDQNVATPSVREALFSQVEGLGTYLRNTSTTSWPRWQQLTALRVYGLNIDPNKASATSAQTSAVNEQAAVQQVQAQLESVARSSRQVSLAQVNAVTVKAAPVANAPKVQISASHVQVTPPPAVPVVVHHDSAVGEAHVAVAKVDTLV